MKDNQNTYLDKVVEFIVRDTKIDYDQKRIQYPFFPSSHFPISSIYPLLLLSPFSKYCKNVYGLTNQEIEYVWKEYRTIILDKIR